MVKKETNICRAELRIMEVLWEQGEMPARQIYRILEDKIGWKKSTTYTMLQKCIEKGLVGRREPKYVCRALLSLEEVQEIVIARTAELYFGGSRKQLFHTFLKTAGLDAGELQALEDMLGNINARLE